MNLDILNQLTATIKERQGADPSTSYVAKLLSKGPKKIAQKVGEEAVELAIAAACESDTEVAGEAADLLFHLLVLIEARDMHLSDVLDVLAAREGLSGLAEKAARTD